mmetsp:Transcript_106973/g.319906  ORF Transcript_106973/g.319906 Transcript_106973/m.319906 type:complete len:205 (-) Transcript_106973:940-1554(-)
MDLGGAAVFAAPMGSLNQKLTLSALWFMTTTARLPSGFRKDTTSRTSRLEPERTRLAPGLMYLEKWARYQNAGWYRTLSLWVSQMMGATQRLPTWLGPPVSSKYKFQSIQPSVPEFRSAMMFMPYRSPNFHMPSTLFRGLPPSSWQPSVKRMCLSGLSSATLRTFSKPFRALSSTSGKKARCRSSYGTSERLGHTSNRASPYQW